MLLSSLCYLEREGELLLLHRVKKAADPNQGKWIGVGGKFEEGESPEECAVRELREETGLTMLEPELRGIVTFVNDRYPTEYMFLFTCSRFFGGAGGRLPGRGAPLGKKRGSPLPPDVGRGPGLFPAAAGRAALFLAETRLFRRPA